MHIKTKELVKNYGKKVAVNNISIEVKEGEVVGLLGPNGAGKTTTFYMVVGLIRPNSGQVFLGDKDITKLPMHKRAHLGIGYLPQESSIFRKLTVEENILVLWELMPEIKPAEYESKLVALLDELGVTHLRKQKAYTLSGGEQRRVEIARALATNPSFLLLDEPFTGIDPKTLTDLKGIVKHLKDKGIGILITDHNVRETLSITDRAYIIHKGEILVSGNSATVSQSEAAKKSYLGDDFEL
ncbi:LPS export ABC transporter ATP-binding protein [candidate division WOR-1 bacterium RIFOXYB2_FULL_42_35]|uniref:LPS export ABC transporter ATP-binding protein n=1 Tax=candidate division WOR-1 bacterium RIFOXYC2_FULL_41_25 TaxID=1802586 RepID=A0A1F4TQZ0_UNCSA|nr:MAG: LPS export ABC transporter ATP-binding protein [candidate division WOR-1 bacterium RIFOXYA2_FULL_41_14]OGC25083.1 MAG: LPS export ABC transporter ATP-binding protein [candidate division WOR-1 bacterium RIFOXYB2_FULL_42_35]OGC34483.1 MAG: LPS export ABC transporter ATP-binding protein [candidate division WOR-1 bacterium RIFOXYC2_FULL_41_25]OGC43877.1 MAG: LPS export ABC transporter ATP-binding protein [candidate division WOR-1 bacterium RIFOXYD2_FULL_41_8]